MTYILQLLVLSLPRGILLFRLPEGLLHRLLQLSDVAL